MKNSREILGMSIKIRRQEKDITQQQLASLLSVDRQYIWRLENGRINFTMNYLDKIIKELNCQPEDFIVVDEENIRNYDKFFGH